MIQEDIFCSATIIIRARRDETEDNNDKCLSPLKNGIEKSSF